MKIEVHSYRKQEHRHRGNHIHHCPQLANHHDHLVQDHQDHHDHHDHLVQDHQGCLYVQPQLDPWSRLSSKNSHHSIFEPLHNPSSTHIIFVHYYHYRHHLHDYCLLKVKTIRVDDRNIAIQLWDTAGPFQLSLSMASKFSMPSPSASTMSRKAIKTLPRPREIPKCHKNLLPPSWRGELNSHHTKCHSKKTSLWHTMNQPINQYLS